MAAAGEGGCTLTMAGGEDHSPGAPVHVAVVGRGEVSERSVDCEREGCSVTTTASDGAEELQDMGRGEEGDGA